MITASVWEHKDNDVTRDTVNYNASFAQQQAKLDTSNSDDPASILAGTIPNIAYVSLSTLVGKSAVEKLVAEAAAYADASTAPYKKTLQQQVAFLKQYQEVVSQMELIGLFRWPFQRYCIQQDVHFDFRRSSTSTLSDQSTPIRARRTTTLSSAPTTFPFRLMSSFPPPVLPTARNTVRLHSWHGGLPWSRC
jgi:hypothetical protein